MESSVSCTIGDLCDSGLADLQTGPFGSQLHASDYSAEGVAVVPTEAIAERRIDHCLLPRVGEAKARELRRHRLEPGDILFARRGAQATGRVALVRPTEDGFLCGTGAIRLRLHGDVSSDYVSHILSSPATREWLRTHAIGATMPNLNKAVIRSVPLRLLPLPEQQAVARFLSAFDDKIELNRRMSRTLESIVRTIFKSWFVDFDPVRWKVEGGEVGLPPDIADLFPKALDIDVGIPLGWDLCELGDVVTVHQQTAGPREIEHEIVDYYSIPAFDKGRLPSIVTGSAIGSSKYVMPAGCVLISRLNPRIPRAWLPRPAQGRRRVCSTEFLVLTTKERVTPEFLYGLSCSDRFRDELASRVTGTSGSHQRVRSGDALSILVPLPPSSLPEAYSIRVASLLDLGDCLLDTGRALKSTRDALLPHLVAGHG